jgi:hypothetical protein
MDVALIDLLAKFEKYAKLTNSYEFAVMKDGVEIARLVKPKPQEERIAERVAAAKAFIGCMEGQDVDVEKIRTERFL